MITLQYYNVTMITLQYYNNSNNDCITMLQWLHYIISFITLELLRNNVEIYYNFAMLL